MSKPGPALCPPEGAVLSEQPDPSRPLGHPPPRRLQAPLAPVPSSFKSECVSWEAVRPPRNPMSVLWLHVRAHTVGLTRFLNVTCLPVKPAPWTLTGCSQRAEWSLTGLQSGFGVAPGSAPATRALRSRSPALLPPCASGSSQGPPFSGPEPALTANAKVAFASAVTTASHSAASGRSLSP